MQSKTPPPHRPSVIPIMPPKTPSKSPFKSQTPQPTTRDEIIPKAVSDAPTLTDVYQPAPPNGFAKPFPAGRRLAYPLPRHISPIAINNTQSLLRVVILGLISAAAIGARLFAVIRFESVIHEL